jgi:hypothetical protein
LDQSPTVALSLKCPSCGKGLAQNEPGPSATNAFLQAAGNTILANYTSEGGVEEGINLMPSITEEAYLISHPDARPARAFHVMCSEGDTEGIVMMLSSLQEAEGSESDLVELLRYQDPLANNKSGLHLAVEHSKEEVVILLIWLCSNAASESFPQHVRQVAEASGIGRLMVAPSQDVRSLPDANGLTAAGLAHRLQGIELSAATAELLLPPSEP